jgi:hypothetical protein
MFLLKCREQVLKKLGRIHLELQIEKILLKLAEASSISPLNIQQISTKSPSNSTTFPHSLIEINSETTFALPYPPQAENLIHFPSDFPEIYLP